MSGCLKQDKVPGNGVFHTLDLERAFSVRGLHTMTPTRSRRRTPDPHFQAFGLSSIPISDWSCAPVDGEGVPAKIVFPTLPFARFYFCACCDVVCSHFILIRVVCKTLLLLSLLLLLSNTIIIITIIFITSTFAELLLANSEVDYDIFLKLPGA